MEKLIIFDTTMRDGEQSPGASMTRDEKIRIAHALEKMRVDVMEAGFPAASPGDFEAVKAVAEAVKNASVCALARATVADIERTALALKPARQPRIHVFIATSELHMAKKLGMSPEQVLEQAVASVRLARQHVADVEFSPEDAGRSDLDFLCRVVEATIAAGARTINIPDTVGYNVPGQFAELIRQLRQRVPNSDQAVFSVHCHNDLGLAVANSLAAVLAGARQVECTINGLGERAGNAALEEIVMAVRTRSDVFACDTNIDSTQILATSRLVSSITGFVVQPNKAIVGANAFAHESGIHQDGVIKHRETYEIMKAEDVGWHTNKLVLGKHSGRNALMTRLRELSLEVPEEQVGQVFARFKELADKKHEVFDEDLYALVLEEDAIGTEHYRFESLAVSTSSAHEPKADLVISHHGQQLTATASGDGPVDAALKAVEQVVNSGAKLLLYSVSAITTGTNSQGEVTVRLAHAERVVNGQGADTDIIVASVKAYLDALNRLNLTPKQNLVQWSA